MNANRALFIFIGFLYTADMYIIFDIGGTKTRIARSDDLKTFGAPVVFDTPQNADLGIRNIIDVARNLAGEEKVNAIAGGVPGPVQPETGVPVKIPNLSEWAGRPIAQIIAQELGTHGFLANDAALGALGEAHFGAGRGRSIVAFLTISTGVGGARIVNGKIDEASLGFEPGHEIIDADKTLCPDCDGNDLESYISGRSLAHRYKKEKPYQVTDPRVWNEELPQFLAYGLHNIIVHWSPDIIVLGGPMIVGDPAISIPETARRLALIPWESGHIPPIVKAELGAFSGLYGAMAYLKERI